MTWKRKTHEEFAAEVYQLVGDEYEILGKYTGVKNKVLMKHNKCGCGWEASPSNFLRGKRCPDCYGSKKWTHEKFIAEVKELVGDEYTVLGEYKNAKTKVLIRHNVCKHEREVVPSNFLSGKGCRKCSGLMKKTHEEFVDEVYQLVGDEYKVLGVYVNTETKLIMKHVNCGHEWNVRPANFLHGTRCQKCYGPAVKTHEEYLKEVRQLFGNEYSILGEYVNSYTKLTIRHNKCGNEWNVASRNILTGRGCPKCGQLIRIKKATMTHSDFVEKFKKRTNGEYSIIGRYTNSYNKIEVRHDLCGYEWNVHPRSLLNRQGCPKCKASKGESEVRRVLIDLNIGYVEQYKFDECRNINPLPFDFAVFDSDNLVCLIEYQGEQHYQSIDFFGGNNGFEIRRKRDSIKRQYCRKNKIPLIEIPYTEKDIEGYLSDMLSQIMNDQIKLTI